MKTKTKMILLAATAGLLSVSANLSAQNVAIPGLPKNRAILSSPRTLEQYPEILRTQSIARGESQTEKLAKLTENRALAASPRFREEHPELVRPESFEKALAARTSEQRERLGDLTGNRALAASPRYLEEHPEVLRSTHVFEIAPLK